MTEQKALKQDYDGQTLEHVIVHDETGRVLPTVILIPTVMGVQQLELGFAEKLVDRGYHAVVVDLFGRRFTPGVDKEAAFAAMGELRSDRAALRDVRSPEVEAPVSPPVRRYDADAASRQRPNSPW